MIYGRIYKITNVVNNKIYIGQTIHTIKHRWNEHVCKSKTENTYLYKSMRKYGVNNFKIEQIDEAVDKQELDEKERNYIASFNSFIPYGYNISLGGGNNDNFTHNPNMEIIKQHMKESSRKRWDNITEEERNRISKLRREMALNPNAIYQSKEYKEKMRKICTGRRHSEETKQKISQMLKGKKHTDDSKKKMSIAVRNRHVEENKWWYNSEGKHKFCKECPGEGWKHGRINGHWNFVQMKKVKCIETSEIFESISSAARYIGVKSDKIKRSCKKGYSTKGYHWCYVENESNGEPL